MKKHFLLIILTSISLGLFSQNIDFSQSHLVNHQHLEISGYQSNLDSLADILEKENFTDKTLIKHLNANNIDLKHKEQFANFLEAKYESDFALVNYFIQHENTITLDYLKNLTDSLVAINLGSFTSFLINNKTNLATPLAQQFNKSNLPVAAATPCNNLDFANGTAGWQGYYGGRRICRRFKLVFVWVCTWWLRNWKNNPGKPGWGPNGISPNNTPANTTGPLTGSQFCINTPGFFDPSVFGLSTTPPNGANSLRLGSQQINDLSAQKAENTFAVTSANKTLTYHYAVVIQDPGGGHSVSQQPYFKVRVRDQAGNEIQCFSFDVTGQSANWIGGFQTVASVNGTIGNPDPDDANDPLPPDPNGAPGALVKDWTSVLVPLDNYIGQNVTLSFETNDCKMGAHFAYAYVSAECGNKDLVPTQPTVCRGNTGKIVAPSGAFQYNWAGPGIVSGQTNDTVSVNLPGVYSCTMTLFSNSGASCTYIRDTLVTLDPRAPHASFATGPVCMGTAVSFTNNSLPLAEQPNSDWDFQSDNVIDFVGANPPSFSYLAPGTYSINLTMRGAFCIHDTTIMVLVNAQPTANFSANSVCQATTTVFTDLSTITSGTITSWDWDFTNNGSIDDVTQNPSFLYPSSAAHVASLKVTSNKGCSNTYTSTVNVWGHSIPDFSADNVCFGTATTFNNLTNTVTNLNMGSISGYSWDFGDGSAPLSSIDANHTYLTGGNVNATYNATLTATTNHGCVDKITKVINVYSVPTVSFTSNQVCFGVASQMNDASTGNGNAITNYTWDFLSDASIDVIGSPNPTFVFPTSGDNSVTFAVSTTPTIGLTCTSFTTQNVWVNPNPFPDFTFVNKCINNQPLTYDASSSLIAIGSNTAYAWAYGDASVGTGVQTTHSFAAPGAYNTTLTVTSDKGCQSQIIKQVQVYQKPLMSISNSKACDTKAMTFTATAQPNSGNVTHWFWDFNNTITSLEADGKNVSYVFPTAGNQTVALIAETEQGCKDTIYHPVYVDYVPKPSFTVDKQSGCSLPLCVTFTDNTTPITGPGLNSNWKWVFGNGTVINANSNASQTNCYTNSNSSQSALFDVKLVVTTDQGCTDSIEKMSFITVYPKPFAQFSANPNPGNVVTPLVYFTNESQDYTKWWWSFGDALTKDSTSVSPSHFYNSESADFYNASLMVSNQYGCRDTAFLKVNIGPEFTFYVPNAFSPETVDGVNDVFTGKGIGISEYEMRIYDRWGANVYTTNDINKGWDGTIKGGHQAKQDVYTWKVQLKDVFNRKHDYVGHVTLLR